MTIVMDGLRYLAYILIFPGFLFCFLTGLFRNRSFFFFLLAACTEHGQNH